MPGADLWQHADMREAPLVDPVSGRPTDGGPGLDHLDLLASLQDRFASAVAASDPAAPVPACGDWRVRDLVEHLAGVHHWAAAQARAAAEIPLKALADAVGARELEAFYRAQATELHATLVDVGPDGAAWTLLGHAPASFWWRRQVHETLVHLHDLRAAAAGSHAAVVAADDEVADTGVGLAPEVWADGVEEVVTMFQPRQVRLGRTPPLGRTVRLEATDVDRAWTLGAHEDGRPPQDAAAVVRAPARDLDLLLWRRLTLAETTASVTGDAPALDDALAAAIVP
jgi:uncharacterized protein (TIGR03083 family)